MERLSRAERAAGMREARRTTLLRVAMELSKKHGLYHVTRAQVAAKAGMAVGSINHAFGTMAGLRDAVVREAVTTRTSPVIRDALRARHPVALAAPAEVRQAAA